MTCSADHRRLIRKVIAATFNEADPTKPFDFVKFIKEFYEQAKTALNDDLLAFDIARLMPELATQVLTTDAATKPLADGKSLKDKMRSLGVSLGMLDDLTVRYENTGEVNKDLGLDIDPEQALKAAEEAANKDKPVKEESKTPLREIMENPFKFMPLGAFFTYGPEIINYTDPSKPNYMVPRPQEVRNYATMRYIDSVMSKQVRTDGIANSGEMDLPGVGKVFLKITHAINLSRDFQKNFDYGGGNKIYFNAGELIAVLVDENGNDVLFSEEGKPDANGKPVLFRPYSNIGTNENGQLAFTTDELNKFFKRKNIDQRSPNAIPYKQSLKTLEQKLKSLVEQKQKADPKLSREEAVKQAKQELNDNYALLFDMTNYLVKTPGSSVQAVINGGAQGFVVYNEYKPSSLTDVVAEGEFFPFSVTTAQEAGSDVKETNNYFSYPGVKEPIPIINPSLKSRPEILKKLLSLFTDELFVMKNGVKERMSIYERKRLIEQFILGSYSNVNFMGERKGTTGEMSYENVDGTYTININGQPYRIKYDGSPESKKVQEEIRAQIEAALTTPIKGEEYTEGFESLDKVNETLKTHEGANIVTDLSKATEGSILKEGDKYYAVQWPTLIPVGKLMGGLYEEPVIVEDAENNKLVTLQENSYNDFMRTNFVTSAVGVNGVIKKLNPTISYGPTLEGASKFMAGVEEVSDQVEEELPKIEEVKEEKKPNTEATQKNIADMSDDDLMGAIEKIEKKAGQKTRNEKLSAEALKKHEEAARLWWASSPLSGKISFEIMQAVANADNPTGPVGEWSVHGIILYHYYSENGKFDQSKSADYTDLYHEAWHGFTQTFLTQEQRTKLYAEVRKRSGSFMDYNGKLVTFKEADVWQLEEFLAEEFREYMMSGGKMVVKGAPTRNTIFRKLLNLLKALFKGSSVTDVVEDPLSNNMVKEIYENLRVGDLSAYNFDINNRDKSIGKLNKAMVARTKIEGQPSQLSYDQSMLLVNTMDSLISGIANKMNTSNNTHAYSSQLMSTTKNRKIVYELVKRKLEKEVIRALKEEQEKETNPILKNQIGEHIKLVEYAILQFGDTEDLSKNKDGKGLIAYHATKSKYLSVEDKIAALEEEAEEENPEEEGMAGKDNKFGSSGNELSQYDLATPEVKYLLRSIFKFDEKNEPSKNVLGVQELNEASVMWNKIVRAIDGVMTMPEMYKKIDEAAYRRNSKGEIIQVLDPALGEVLNKLGPVKTTSAAETDLWINFWKTFNMVNIPLVQMTMTEHVEDGVTSYTMTIGAANTASRQALNLWRNSFLSLNTEYIKSDEQNTNYLDVKKVLKDFMDPETGKLKQGESFEFLRAIGLRLTDKGAIREAIKNGVGNAPQLFLKLKALGDPDGRNINQLRSLDELFDYYPKTKDYPELKDDNGNLKALTELETRNSDFSSNYSVTNAKGNMQFEQSLHNSMSIMVNTIDQAQDLRDDDGNILKTAYKVLIESPHMRHLDIDENPFAASSVWLNSVFMLYDEKGNRYSDKIFGQRRLTKDGKPYELKLSNLSGVQMVNDKGSVGIDSAGADEFTKLIMDFHMQTVANKPELMRHADKGTSYSIWLDNIFLNGASKKTYVDTLSFFNTGSAQVPEIRGYNELHKTIKKYIDAEVKRMAKMRQMKEAIKNGDKVQYDANYINEGQKVLIFESILSPDTKKILENVQSLQEAIDKNPDLDTMIRNDIESYFEEQTNDLQQLTKKNKTKFISNQLILETQRKARNNVPDSELVNVEKPLFRAFVVNNWIHNIESMNIVYGDIAQYNMAKEEFHKRNAGAGSTGNLFAANREIIDYVNSKGRLYAKSQNIAEKKLAQDGSYDTAIMADNEIPSAYLDEIKEGIEDSIRARYERKLELAKGDEKELAKLEKEIADKVKKATKAYTEMNEGDAQGWITFDFYRAASIMEGKWTTKQEKMYRDIANGVSFTPEQVSQFFPTKKYQYWGPIQVKEGQLPVYGFHKFSLLPLIPTVIKGTNLEKLHDKMMRQGVDYSLFKSGSKIATITNLSYNAEKDQVKADQDKFYTKDRNFDEDGTFVKNTAFFSYLKNQLEIAPKFKRKVTFPTQMRKLIENGLYENGIPLKPEYEELVKAYETDLRDLTELKKAKLEKEAGIERDASGKIVFNEKLRKFLIAELERQELAEHEIDFIRKAPGKDKLARDLSISLSSQKLEKILTSIVVKRLVKQKFNGEGLIQVSGAGWETNLRGKLTDQEKLDYGTNELPFYRREVLGTDKNGKKIYGKTLAMKVKIALQGDFVKLLGLTHKDKQPIGTIDRLNEMLKDEEWLNEGDHRKMISITGPRIPTQENNSMEFAEVYEFLPKEAGNIVVLPSEIVAKSGGDFDIDKITFMMPNIKSSPNFEDIDFKAIGERFPEFGEEGARTIFENRKEDTRSDEEQEVLDAIYDSVPMNVSLPFDSTSEAGLENRILDDMRKILELKELYANLVRPNDTDLIKPIAEKLEKDVSEYQPRTVAYTNNKGETAYRIPGSRVFEIRYNLYKHSSNNIGKQTLGLGAVDNTYNTIFNRIGARFNAGYTTKNNVYRKLNLLLPHNTLVDQDGNSTISISHLYDVEGTSISSVIAQMINGWVDIAKDAWIFNVQGNKEIAPTLLFMVQAGIPVRQAVYYVSHPLIRQYVTEQKMAKSIFAKPLGKGEGNPMFARNEARNAMFKLIYKDNKFADSLRSGKALDNHLNNRMDTLLNNPESKAFDFFNSDKVEENLLKRVKDKEQFDEADEAIFLHFIEMEEMAKGLRDIKMSTNVDTSRTNSIYEAETKLAAFEATEYNKMFPKGMVAKIKEESPIGSFFIQDFQIDFLKELFPLKANSVINDFLYYKTKDLSTFDNAVKSTFGNAEDLINTFRNDLPAFIFQNQLRKLSVTDKNEYRGVLLDRKLTVKTTPSLKFGVFVKNVKGKPVIYIDKNQLSNNYKNLGNLDQSIKLEDGTVITPAPVDKSYFDSEQAYAAFLMERELIRYRYTQPGKFELIKERLDFKNTLEKLKNNELKLENETDAHFEARMNTVAFEETIRNMALDNTYNMNKLFMSRDSIADQLIAIQNAYPELMREYSVLRNLAAQFTERNNQRVANVMLNDSLLDADKLNIYNQNLRQLSNPATIKLDPSIPAEEKLRLTQFFNNFSIYAFLQSGMNTTGRYSLTRLVPQGQFTRLMTTFLEGENVDGVQTPGFLQNINDLTLEKYWKKFLKVNAYTNSNRKNFKNYTLSPAEGTYNPASDKKTLNKILDSKEFGEMPGDRLVNKMRVVTKLVSPSEEAKAEKEAAKSITFSKDANGNDLYDAKETKRTAAEIALKENPDGIFVINGTASIEGKDPSVGNATSGEAALLGESKGANTVNFPVRKTFNTVDFKLTDVTPDGKPVEVKSEEKKPLFTVEKARAQKTFRKKTLEFVETIPTNKEKVVAMRNVAGQKIQINEQAMRQKFAEKAWTKPTKQTDGSSAKPLPENAFATFEDWFTFALIHEIKHDTIKQNTDESTGAYEDRINEAAMQDFNENYASQTPVSTTRKTYSGKVTSLQPNQIFVFGSNPEGRHGAGAAKNAKDLFGAKYGQGRGMQGQSYALVTKNLKAGFVEPSTGIKYEKEGEKSVSKEQITNNIKELYLVAAQNPTKEFLIPDYSKSNLNGYTGQEMADMFNAAGPIPSNIVFNENFDKLLPSTQPQAPVSTLGPETKINIYAGTGENAELSNFAERPFVGTILGGLGGQQFTSVEQAFQYAKGEYYNVYSIDPSSKETPDTMRAKVEAHLKKILAAKTGAEAKALGRKDIGVDFEDEMWDENSPSIMKQLLKESFQQNPDALAKLLATGNATLTHTQDKGKWGTEFPRLLMEVRAELRGTQLMTTPVDTASNIDSTVKTDMNDDSKTIQPIPGNVINPELAKQIDSMIETMKALRDSGKTLFFPKNGIGQYMIGADEITGELPSGKIVPVAPASFVYLSQKLWDNFKYANPNFDTALGYVGMTNVLQEGAEVNDLDVMEALSVCFKSIIP